MIRGNATEVTPWRVVDLGKLSYRDAWARQLALVEERKQADGKLLATWYLLDKSPYMVYGEVPLPDGSMQRMTEIEIPMPPR